MFGTNEIVGQKYFKTSDDANAGKLFITSRFYTLQGEGPKAGYPAIFIRLTKCNLKCHFCDTFFDDGDWYTVEELADDLKTLTDHDPSGIGIVLTGGEPLLQSNIVPLIKRLQEEYKWVQIESNGIVYQDIPEDTILVISPKCVEKERVSIKYIRPHPKNLENATCLKFVMSSPENNSDYSPYSEVPDWAFEWRDQTGKDIYVSPMNIYNEEPQASKEARLTKNRLEVDERSTIDEVISFWTEGLLDLEANQKNHEYTAKYCMENNCRLNLQMHLYTSLA